MECGVASIKLLVVNRLVFLFGSKREMFFVFVGGNMHFDKVLTAVIFGTRMTRVLRNADFELEKL